MVELYRGVGGSFHPYAPRLDALIIAQSSGLAPKAAGKVVFASTSREQALEYARDNDEANLRVASLAEDAVVYWIEGVKDMTLGIERHLNRLRMGGIMRHRGVDFGRVLRDAAGDMHVLEMYLSMGRQKRALSAAVDHYLKDKVVRSASALELDRSDVLEEHDGEVWISGGCEWRLLPSLGPSMR